MSNSLRVDLLSNASATGAARHWPGGKGTLFLRGTIGGATITLETELDPAGSGVYGPLSGVSLTAAGAVTFDLPPTNIRAAVTGGAPSALFAHVVRINP